ncbi:acetate/propionate family kinase [Streptococcus massiliensis]|uniref:acetate/propionate family kinase n=1 Tax=Streptococcus massiliensis TaxID=313439 RepID=UPI00034BA6BB|nr:acetate kinase [Streptococcus massiliensis]
MRKKIMVINSGSSSLKFQIYDLETSKLLAKGIFERIGIDHPTLTISCQGKKVEQSSIIANHHEAVQELMQTLLDRGIILDLLEIVGVGHRVAHGGTIFTKPTVVTELVEAKIEELAELAPLHNPINLLGIRAFKSYLPQALEVAVFDTAFHQTMEEAYYTYPIPYEYREKYGIRRYGFHGISHQYISDYVTEHYGLPEKMICAHLGNGSSICAMKNGLSYTTSMGFTPTAGLMMGTRCGDIDPMIVSFLEKHENFSGNQIDQVINQKSGLRGISGFSSDMRDIELAATQGNSRAELALDIFANRVIELVGSYISSLNGLDVLVFTAGIGEHSATIRKKVCQRLTFLGLDIDDKKNQDHAEEISSSNSKIKVLVIPTNEEWLIAQAVKEKLEQLPVLA